jgi:hypothetical protein
VDNPKVIRMHREHFNLSKQIQINIERDRNDENDDESVHWLEDEWILELYPCLSNSARQAMFAGDDLEIRQISRRTKNLIVALVSCQDIPAIFSVVLRVLVVVLLRLYVVRSPLSNVVLPKKKIFSSHYLIRKILMTFY